MKIRSQSNQLIDMIGKATTTVRMPTGSYQILAHTKDKKVGAVLGEYSTEQKNCSCSLCHTGCSSASRESQNL